MSGILDRKSRFIDYKLTVDGRQQMANKDIRFVYASFSDKSIVYDKDFDLNETLKFEVSSTQNYLPLEAPTKNYFEINKEFDLKDLFTTQTDDGSEIITFNEFSSQKSLTENLVGLKLITNRRRLNKEQFVFNNSGFLNNDFSIDTTNYPTIKQATKNVKSLPTIAFDKRFSHKKNLKQLVPVNSQGNPLYDESSFNSFEKRLVKNKGGLGFLIDKINKYIEIKNPDNREESIIEALQQISNTRNIEKNIFELTEYPESIDTIFEMFEINTDNTKQKMQFIDLGEVYDKNSKSLKQIYLIGKILNSRKNSTNANETLSLSNFENYLDDVNPDLSALYEFNSGEIKSRSNIEIALTSYFSFVNVFILVVE